MTVIAVIALLVALMLVGLPIAIAMALTGTIIMLGMGGPDLLVMMAQRLYSATTSFPLLAIPFFILAGNLMNTGGMTQRIFDFTQLLVGRVRGGLAHVNVLGSMIFAGMSGSAVADAAGLGVIEIAAMKKEGYSTRFSAALTCASCTVGPIIPPSIPFVIYGNLAEVSVGALFLGGIIPGLLMGGAMMIAIVLRAKRLNLPRSHFQPTLRQAMCIAADALPAIFTPVIIMVDPIFVPLMVKIGVDPVHFGIVLTLNIMIGLLTPPVGLALYVVADISKVPMSELVMEMWPYMVALLVVLGLVTYVPGFTMFLPHLFGFV